MLSRPSDRMFKRAPMEVDFGDAPVEPGSNGDHPADLETPQRFDPKKPRTPEEEDAYLATCAFDPQKRHPKPEPVYLLGGTPICTAGNLTTVYSQAKTGKSSFIGAMIAATMTNPTSGHDTLGVTGPNYQKHAVLHFDTEQSPYDWEQVVDTAMKRVGLTEPPPWLKTYTMTGKMAGDIDHFIRIALRRAKAHHGGIHSVIIDGIADVVIDPNDPEECFPLITRLHAAAIEYAAPIINVLHMNPGSDVKGRGHLGSQLERKSESNLTLEKVDETTLIYATKQRGKMITREKALAFRWSNEDQRHASCEAPGASNPKPGRTPKYDFEKFVQIIPKPTEKHKPVGQLWGVARTLSEIPRNSFRDLLNREVDKGILDCAIDPVTGPAYRMR